MEDAGGGVVELADGIGGDVVEVEIDQVRHGGDTVGIVTGGAGGLLLDDVEGVVAEAGVAENDGAAVALVTEGVGGGVLGLEIGEDEVAFEQGPENGAVRAVGAAAAGGRAGIAVVAIGAVGLAVDGPSGGDEAGDTGGVAPGGLDRVVAAVAGGELEAGVGFGNLALEGGFTAIPAVGVAAETNFVFLVGGFDDDAGGGEADDTAQGAGKVGGGSG